ncbi:MAG: zinc-dependent metalloprotease [Chitinophagaceae bacterium]|nr:zinc-dependent metalloprotease [Chitinophagaceae bacterium]MCW5904911.1 zinc-dependent metalloprotease [Chitinophagaceae bacterium]
MKFFYRILVIVFAISPLGLLAQNNFFTDKSENDFQASHDQIRPIKPERFRAVQLDVNSLQQFLSTVPMEFTADAANRTAILTLPMPYGGTARFSITESPMQEPGLAAKFPDIKTYSGQGIDDGTATAKLDWTGFGFHVQVLSPVSGSMYIDPYERGNVTNYMSYYKTDLKPQGIFQEIGVEGVTDASGSTAQVTGFCSATLRSYRLAVACTGEYAVAVGGTNAQLLHSAIVTTVNRVNGVYEQEVGVRLILITNNNLIEFLSASSDPFNGNNSPGTLINESQSVITNYIGSANFDIGHTFSTGGGGLAGLGVVCNNAQKARGITGSGNPTGDAYDIDFVAHEMGHQFSGRHTFNATTGNCGGGNRSSATAVEPGSGVTIMGYAGICGSTNDLENNSIPNFHSTSQGEIGNFKTSGGGSSCGTNIATGNTAPVVNAGSNYTIPANTPFMLTGSATDADGDILTYSWEEYDLGTAGNWNSGNKPFFRSFVPTTSPTRYFPKMSDIINNTQTKGEYLPQNSQSLNFRLTVRDNKSGGAGVCSDEMTVTVVSSTAFKVTSQSSSTSWTANGSNTATVTWNVSGTNTAPINCTGVDILFSGDGGLTYPYTLKSNTPNDGAEDIIIPAVATGQGRIMVKGNGNIFFSINNANITVTSVTACDAEGATLTPTTQVNAIAGSASLNLSLSPLYSAPLSMTGTVTSSDPTMNLPVYNTGTFSCQVVGNVSTYRAYTFVVNTQGSYTFTRQSPTPTNVMMTLYQNSFNSSSPCTNFISSNGSLTGSSVSIGGSITAFLVQGQAYTLVIGTFASSQPSLPFNYSVTYAGPGTLFSGSGNYSDPGAGYSYAYVIVNNSTNIIKAISNTANLSNASTYPSGSYTIYGLSYINSIASALQTFVGSSFANFTTAIITQPGTYCANLSKNTVSVNIGGVVPVTFTELTAKKRDNNVVLNWGTVTEINSSHFVIERSANGRDFTNSIGELAAAGNSTTQQQYTFTDNMPFKGLNYYRIKQVDKDGAYTYSNTVAINFEKGGNIVIVYPNPVKHTLRVEYAATKNGKVQVQVLDARGSFVIQNNYTVTIGKNIHAIQTSTLATGVYVLKYTDVDGNTSFTKFIKE